MTQVLGYIVAVLSYPVMTYKAVHEEGLKIMADDTLDLPFSNPGMSVCVKKGRKIDDKDREDMEKAGFTSMAFSGRTIFVKEGATDTDFELVCDMNLIDTSGPSPGRYLNVDAYESWLILKLITKKIAQLFHYLGGSTSNDMEESSEMDKRNKPTSSDWTDAKDFEGEEDTRMQVSEFKFRAEKALVMSGIEARIGDLLKSCYSVKGVSVINSRVVVNPTPGALSTGFINAGDTRELTSPGAVFKFHPQLARPDPNLVTDVIGKFFMAALGDSWSDQADVFGSLKTGIAQLRLTRLGDELTHFYKCIEVAIESGCGAIPFFHGSSYEGCVLSGSAVSVVEYSIQNQLYTTGSLSDLKNSFLNVSTHEKYLRLISLHFNETYQTFVLQSDSMRKLWAYCQLLECTQDVRDAIIRMAAHLDYGQPSLVINPHNIKLVCSWIIDINQLPMTAPISRLALFSKDPVLLALGCFGEKTAPSWNVPGGTECSLKKRTVPIPLVSPVKAGKAKGVISDAAWTMVVMKTDLVTAVEDFKDMAIKMRYRSTGTSMAKKVGHLVFNRERMAEFWTTLQDSLKVVNPKAVFQQGEGDGTGSPDTMGREVPQKKRKIDFVSPSKKKLKQLGREPEAKSVVVEEEVVEEPEAGEDELEEGETRE